MPHPSLRRRPAPRRFDHGQPIRGIDTRPTLYVSLFIAVVFLLAASQTRTHALLVELPQPDAGLIEASFPTTIYRVEITASGQVQFNGMDVGAQQLELALVEVGKLSPRAVLAFEPHGDAAYDLSVHTLAIIQRAGVNDEWFCINGMEKHGEFGKASGHPLPLLLTFVPPEELSLPPHPPTRELPDIDTCAPELFGRSGR
jgi:biopolymer transport protein ExbD